MKSFGKGRGNRLEAAAGSSGGDVEQRLDALEREVQELRAVSRRLADVVDVVTELLVPAVDRDDERLASALERLQPGKRA